MKKIAVFFAEGFEEIEALTVVDLCRRAGIDTQMVSVSGQQSVTGSHKITVAMDAGFESDGGLRRGYGSVRDDRLCRHSGD